MRVSVEALAAALGSGIIRWLLGYSLVMIAWITWFFVSVGLIESPVWSPFGLLISCIVIRLHFTTCIAPCFPLPIAAHAIVKKRAAQMSVLAAVVLVRVAARVTCHLYDVNNSSFRWYSDDSPDWVPGLTPYRFLMGFLAQAAVFAAGFTGPVITVFAERISCRSAGADGRDPSQS